MSSFRFAVFLLLAAPASLFAQQPPAAAAQQSPGVLVVSAQKCRFTALPELQRNLREIGAPILNELVRQGRLNSWGVLEHAWGDEWNLVIYYSSRDLNTFTAAYGEYFRQYMQRDPQVMQRLEQACTEHKDNIYTITMTNATTQR